MLTVLPLDALLISSHNIPNKSVMIAQWDSSLSVLPVAQVQYPATTEYSKGFFPGWSHSANPSWASVAENGSISPQLHRTTRGQWGGRPKSNHGQMMADRKQIYIPNACPYLIYGLQGCKQKVSNDSPQDTPGPTDSIGQLYTTPVSVSLTAILSDSHSVWDTDSLLTAMNGFSSLDLARRRLKKKADALPLPRVHRTCSSSTMSVRRSKRKICCSVRSVDA